MNKEYDFGFSLVSEEELKAHEEHLIKRAENESQKLNMIKDMIMPLLLNLSKDPNKEYIYWPNRKDKIDQFIKKLNSIVDNN